MALLDEKQKENLLKQMKAELQSFPEIEFAYVHGSFVDGNPFKDIDIAILTENRQTDPLNYELDLEVKLYRKLDFPADVRVLNSAPNAFCFHVIKEGALLFTRDENKRSEFETRVFSSYADFLPFKRRYLEEVLNLKYNQDRLSKLVGEVEKALKNLEDLASLSKSEFLKDVHKISSAKYNFTVAIEGIVDICNHLISQNKLRAPEDYADTFKVMEESGSFNKDFAETLIKMVRFRNRLVHLYWEVDDATVYDILAAQRSDIKRFLASLSPLLSK